MASEAESRSALETATQSCCESKRQRAEATCLKKATQTATWNLRDSETHARCVKATSWRTLIEEATMTVVPNQKRG